MSTVDDQEVWRIVNLELSRASGASVVQTTGYAWPTFKAPRRDGVHATDVNVAAAEHYMYSRFLTGRTGDPLTRLYPTAYFLKKVAFFAVGKEEAMRTDPANPVLPPWLASVAWGNQGAIDGMSDYKSLNAATGMQVGASVEKVKAEAYRNNK